MDYRDIYKNWLASGALTADEKAELSAISDDLNAQKDRFGAELEFGTAGMRGVLGAGINRMNVYTVARATKGLARYIIGRGEDAMRRGVVVSYDTRRFSTEFAIVSAEVLNSFGIRVYLFENVRPVPVCSFAIRNLNAVAGIMITASHNPKIYNGYKVYGEDGAQMSPEDTAVVVKFIEEEKDYFAPYKKNRHYRKRYKKRRRQNVRKYHRHREIPGRALFCGNRKTYVVRRRRKSAARQNENRLHPHSRQRLYARHDNA